MAKQKSSTESPGQPPIVDKRAGDAASVIQSVLSTLQTTGVLNQASVDLDLAIGEPQGACRFALKVMSAAASTAALAGASAAAPVATVFAGGADLGASPEFNSEGHHVIALMAEKDLTQNSPATMQAVNDILAAVDRDLREAATFPDDIRNKQPKTKPFHFIDIPFEDDGAVTPPLPAAPHVLSKLDDFSQFLSDGGGTKQERADAVSWLIHLFGDVHQPLHCITHFSDLHPKPEGDRGGNGFRIKSAKKNLHSLWDSSVNVTQNIDEDALADQILQEHPRSSLGRDLAVTDPVKWARASFALAKRVAYSLEEDPANPPAPSASYKANMEKIGRKQAALAAYRLADRLTSILS